MFQKKFIADIYITKNGKNNRKQIDGTICKKTKKYDF